MSGDPPPTDLHHVATICPGMDRAQAFYGGGLDFHTVERTSIPPFAAVLSRPAERLAPPN